MATVSQVVQQGLAALRGMNPSRRAALIVLTAGTAVGLTLLALWGGGVDMRVLYSQLDPQDAGAVISRLKEMKIPYRLEGDGRTIAIPAPSIPEVRMQLASEGLPQGGGIGFEVFDNTRLGISEFAQNVNFQRALQGELARTIARIAEVESCRVHLVMPEKSLFVGEERPASASVAVKLKPGRRLSAEQVSGIVHLVSSSVPRLAPDQVTVVDQSGKLLAGPRGKLFPGAVHPDHFEYQAQVEKALEARVRSMLEQALGEGKAVVRLACEMDFRRAEKTEEQFLPENRVIRSEQSLSESSRNAEGPPQGVPGIRSNAPGPDLLQNQTAAPGGGASFEKQDRTVNYEIGKVTQRVLEPVGKLMRVSVAVLVDGTYRSVPQKGGEPVREFVPRSPEELQKIEALVKRAVGFDAERGDKVEVVNIPFQAAEGVFADAAQAPSGWKAALEGVVPYVKPGAIGLFLLLLFFFFVRPIVRWLTDSVSSEVEIVKQLPMRLGDLEQELAGVKSLPSLNQASLLVASDSEASLGAVRNWLKENG